MFLCVNVFVRVCKGVCEVLCICTFVRVCSEYVCVYVYVPAIVRMYKLCVRACVPVCLFVCERGCIRP